MKELIKAREKGEKYKNSEVIMAVVSQGIAVIVSFVASRAVVAGRLMPFGIAFLAGCPRLFSSAAAIGAFAGYFIPAVGSGGFRYISALLAILAIRLILSGSKKISENPIFLSSIAMIANAITSAVALNGLQTAVIDLAAESLLCGIGAFFVYRAGLAIKHSDVGLSGDELAALLIVISILLMGLRRFSLYGVSLGQVLGIFLILSASKYGGTLAGAVSGIAVAFSALLSGMSGDTSVYYFGGLTAGVFCGLGKYAEIAAVGVCCIISAAYGKLDGSVAALAVQVILGSAFFLMLPRGAGIHLGKLFSGCPRVVALSGIKKALTMRLSQASGALSEVSETVEQVSRELNRINSPDFSTVIIQIEQQSCVGCKLRMHCWEAKRSETVEAVVAMTKAVKDGNLSPELTTTEEFKVRCLRLPRVGEAVYRRYSDYASKISAENRIEEVRSVVSDQFDGISNMLEDLAADFADDEQFDNSAAVTAAAALKNLNIRADECSARIDKYGRMTIEVKTRKSGDIVFNKLHIMKTLSIVCERDFDIPVIIETNGDIYISITEHAVYKIDVGISQINANEAMMCGDACNYFNDGKGHFIAVLSDGMGTGGRAAVDGAMASGLMSRLLKAGFGYDCSLRILNSSMLFKSTDESLATVDITSIDLFTGEVELYKAGAAPTVVRRNGKTGRAESTSLPIGILRNIGFDRAGIKLKTGDILLMLSDGAVSEGTDWIRAELESWREGSSQDLADHIAECAFRRRTDRHEDDITVISAILEKAV